MNYNFAVNNQLSPQELQVHELVNQLLIVLSKKERYIVENRFSLNKEANEESKMTLEEIGKHFGVTRERIRQIESSALRKLERSAKNTNIKILTEFAKALLEKEGSIVSDKRFKKLVMEILPNINEEEIHDLHLALVLDPEIHFQSNTLKHRPHWRLSTFNGKILKVATSKAQQVLKKAEKVLTEAEITEKVNQALKMNLEQESVINMLKIAKEFKFTSEGVGLYSWRSINPRTLRDKINFIFQKEKKPLHFDKIAKFIKEANFDHKTINMQAVHNELIRNEDFILVGRGLYALKDWGYQAGTVADVIGRLLEDGKARTREEITKAVLKQRHVKTITIYLNLKNKDQFVRIGRDRYTLKKFAKKA